MTIRDAHTSRLVIGCLLLVALATGCGGSTAQPQPSPAQITGGASCPAAEAQDLTFSGALSGHLACSTSAAKCSTNTGKPSLTVPLNGRLGTSDVQLLIAFSFWHQGMKQDRPGTYPAGRLGDAQDSSPYGATLDGDGHWETPTPGGTMTLSTDDATGATGTVDVKLASGTRTIALAGSWRCVKP